MQQATATIAKYLSDLIKESKPAYTIEDLRAAGFPVVVTEQIRYFVEDQMRSELVLTQSKWTIATNRQTAKAWDEFVENAVNNLQIPQKELKEIITLIVAEILGVQLQPRQKIVDFLFGENKILTVDEIIYRSKRLPAYKNYGKAIPLYMQKRDLKEIGYERCRRLIHNLDARITEGYNAKNWVTVLEPLFSLFGGRIPSSLAVIFFEDKGQRAVANIFRRIGVPLTKSTFIELYSRDDLLESEEYTKHTGKSGDVPVTVKLEDKVRQQGLLPGHKSWAEEFLEILKTVEEDSKLSHQKAAAEAEKVTNPDSLNALYAKEVPTLHDATITDENRDEILKEFRENLSSILDIARSSFEGVAQAEEPEEKAEKKAEKKPPAPTKSRPAVPEKKEEIKPEEKAPLVAPDEEPEEEIPEGDDQPMWAHFLGEEQMAILMGNHDDGRTPNFPGIATDSGKNTNNENHEIFVLDDELIIDESGSVEPPKAEEKFDGVPRLKQILRDKTILYVNELFDGSVWEFGEALEHLEQLNTWEEAASYLQHEVFNKNKADLFSETTIEFLDRLQNYFNKIKWRH